ncbi:hypothetical protein [Devosia sp.]|uniref:hypothetical protein n=1 Tax=Devosia sp. TaxID=1871048 RepID=UPI003BAABCC4
MTAALPLHLQSYLATVEPGSVVAVEPIDQTPPPASGSRRVTYADPTTGVMYCVHLSQFAISQVNLDLKAGIVTKTVGRFSEFGILEREIFWLNRLATSGIVPRLISTTDMTLCLTYVGEPVRRYNLPSDWREQAEIILSSLAAAACRHNDIKCDNLTVLDGCLYLLDFGWATAAGDPIPPEWPEGIGRQHRLGIHQFDDRHAIFAALESAERDAVDRSIAMRVATSSTN